jgi:hypothetical protein
LASFNHSNTAPYFRAPCFFSTQVARPDRSQAPASQFTKEFVQQLAVVKKRRLARLDLLEAAVRQRGLAPEQQGPR